MLYTIFVCILTFQGEPHRERCEHEEAAGGGHEDEAEVLARDGEKLPWTSGGAGEEGTDTPTHYDHYKLHQLDALLVC